MADAMAGTDHASRLQTPDHAPGTTSGPASGRFAFAQVPPVVSQGELDAARIRNPFENTPHAAAVDDAALECLGLPARADVRKAMPLSTWVRTFVHGADLAVWTGIERERPTQSLCLSRMLHRALNSEEFTGAAPDEQRVARSFVANTLREMENDWKLNRCASLGFVGRILDLAMDKLATDDAVILTDIAKFMTAGRRFRLELTHVHKKPGPGGSLMCMRVTAKWAMCQATGSPFRYRDLNVDKTAQKHGIYRRAFNEARDAVKAKPDLDRTARLAMQRAELAEAERQCIANWAEGFTDAGGRTHENEVSVGHRSEPIDPETYLRRHALPEGAALMIRFNLMAAGSPMQVSGHAIAVCGGSPPRFFDTNTGEYEYLGDALGKDVAAYVDALYRAKTHGASHVEWQIVPLRRNGT